LDRNLELFAEIERAAKAARPFLECLVPNIFFEFRLRFPNINNLFLTILACDHIRQ